MDNGGRIAIAADIGGTQIRAAAVTEDGRLLVRHAIETIPEDGIESAANRLADIVDEIRGELPDPAVVGMGISTAGPLDPVTGTYKNPPNLQAWNNRSMKPILQPRLGLPVHTGHDATLAAFAETRFGPHRGLENLLYVTISTGVGGGIIANGEMVTGAEGHAGEVGHITLMPGGQSCNVGCDGCFEGNASGPAITKLALSMIDSGEPTELRERAVEDREQVTPQVVFAAADAGDAVGVKVRDHVILAIGIGLGSLLNIFAPQALVVGGGVLLGLENRWDRIVESVNVHSLEHFRDDPRLHITTLGDDVGLLGAGGLAFRESER